MNEHSYLIFELGHSRYGITTDVVEELFLVPDIVPIPETPTYVVGVINLRSEILPIVDLHQRLGQPSPPYQLTDSVVVLQWQSQRLGVLVNRVCEVETLADDQVQHPSDNGRSHTLADALILGVTTLDAKLVVLLNPETLIQSSSRLPDACPTPDLATRNGSAESLTEAGLTSPFAHLSPESQQILQARTDNLRQVVDTQETGGLPVAVVELGDEYLGLELDTVHEFINIRKVTPVPCCPPHILGNINLRGEIVPLVDISHVVNLPVKNSKPREKAIVVRLDQLTAGIAVDEIFDLIYLDPNQISAAPVAVHVASDEYLQGVAAYQNTMMSIINLSKILTTDVLVVDEEV